MTDYGADVGGTSNSKILNVLNALKADGGGDGILKFLNGIMIIRSKSIALRITFPVPFRYPPIVFTAMTSTRRVSSYDSELYPNTVTATGFTLDRTVIDQTTIYGYLAIGMWK